MLLVVDVGNTQTVVGIYRLEPMIAGQKGSELVRHWRIATNVDRTADELALTLTQLLALTNLDFLRDIRGIAVSSVVPRLTTTIRELAARYAPEIPLVILQPGSDVGMPLLVDNPREVGADRIANSVGAFDLYGGPVVVVDFGTATTFDVVSAAGEYLGGLILPGIEISLEALFSRAAALRRVELVAPPSVIGKNTIEHIQSGAVFGFAAQTDGLAERIFDEIGDVPLVATGGLARLIAPHCKRVTSVDPWLTLHGLRIIFERMAS